MNINAPSYASQASSKMKNMYNKLKSVNVKDIAQSMRNNSFVTIMYVFVIIILISMFFTYRWNVNLEKKECNRLNEIYPDLDGSISSITYTKVSKNATNNFAYNLNEYYIKTAYNACSVGNYKNSAVSLCILKDILKQGVRGLDFEIYSLNDKPVVATSMEDNFYVKETFNYVPFADVLLALRDYGFASTGAPNPDDPFILHLRIKSTNNKMFDSLASLFESMGNYMLGKEYSFENDGKNLGNTQLLNFKKKILIIVDKSNSAFMESEKLKEYVNLTSNSVFMRALRYTSDVKYTPDMDDLKNYNKRNLTIVLPDNTLNPDNPNSILSRSLGCQLVAMRYQLPDGLLKEDANYFNQHGHAFVLKPEDLRYKPVFIKEPKKPSKDLSYAPRDLSAPNGLYNFKI